MNIAIISPSLDISWGGQRQVLELARALVRSWNTVSVFCDYYDPLNCHPGLISDVRIISLGYKKRLILVSGDSFLIKFSKFIFNFFRTSYELVVFAFLIRKSHLCGNYDVFNFHDDAIYLAPLLPRKWVWMMNDLPWIMNATIKWYDRSRSILAKCYNFLTSYLLSYAISCCSGIVVLDNKNKALVQSIFWIDSSIVRSGIDSDKFSKYKEIRIQKSERREFSILSTSIFFPHRRFEDAILALADLNSRGFTNFEYKIIGKQTTDPIYFQKIRSLTFDLGLDKKILFLGEVTENELLEYYASSDIFLFPNAPQTWWLAVFEAMLSWCATIVSDWCWASEVLEAGVNAFVVKAKCPKELASKIEILFTKPSEIDRLSIAWAEFVRNNLSWDKYASSMLTVFSRAIWR